MQLTLSTISLALTTAVVVNAWYQKQQFYPAVVYVTKSNASMAVIYIQFFSIVFMFGKLLRKIFLGTLRAAEFEHLLERFWYALTETCLAFTVFRNDFNPRFVALFTVLLFLKSFHWLAEERVDIMERSPVLAWLFHVRVVSLLMLLGIFDYYLLLHSYYTTLVSGPSVQLVFGFEYAILLTIVATTAIKYVLHTIEMRTDTQWENKAVFLLYTELFIGLVKVVLYVVFVIIMTKFYALPMFVFRPMFFTIRNFKKALSDVIMSRRAIRNLNTLYPDATPEELQQSDNICIICREDMINHSKKLPCGHIFHSTCLRSWFQRQQTCPTCRLNILRTNQSSSSPLSGRQDDNEVIDAIAAAAATATTATATNAENTTDPAPGAPSGSFNAAAASSGTGNISNGPGDTSNINSATAATSSTSGTRNARASYTVRIPFEQFLGTSAGNISNNSETGDNSSQPSVPIPPPPSIAAAAPFIMPPYPFIMPYVVSPPSMPPDLTTMTDEELRAMEGNERQQIEQRLELLSKIKVMMDAVDVLINNYQIVTLRTRTNQTTSPASSTTNEGAATNAATSSNTASAPAPAPAPDQPSSPVVTSDATENLSDRRASSPASAPSVEASPPVTDAVIASISTASKNKSPEVAAATTNLTERSADEASQMAELRKRRLKFLQEQNRATNSSGD